MDAGTSGGIAFQDAFPRKLLLGAVPILFMMSVLVAALGPEPVRKLRNLFATKLHFSNIQWKAMLCGSRLSEKSHESRNSVGSAVFLLLAFAGALAFLVAFGLLVVFLTVSAMEYPPGG